MIIRPGTEKPILKAKDSLFALMLFPLCQTREDAETILRELGVNEPLPPVDPNRRAKHWVDPTYVGAEDDGEPVIYITVQRDPRTGAMVLGPNGKPKLVAMALTKAEAGSFNIGTGVANELPFETTYMRLKPVPFPIRELHPDEELIAPTDPFKDVMVQNKRLVEAAPVAFTEAERDAIYRILAAVEKLVK